MVVVRQSQHPQSMDFTNQQRVYLMRKVDKLKWNKIVEKVVNLQGDAPSERQCREVFAKFSVPLGRRKYNYKNCGRKAWKLTPVVKSFIIKRLLALRSKCICTATTLQVEVAREHSVELETSSICKFLKQKGYRWLPRGYEPKYSREDKLARKAFVEELLAYSARELEKKLSMSMDGVVLAVAPTEPTARDNFCHSGETHVYRKPSEAKKPELQGKDDYSKQIPVERQVPMWGGIGYSGFSTILYHDTRKLNQTDWSDAVECGKLTAACREVTGRTRGPWTVLCDNETFLEAPCSRKAHFKANVHLWHVPARSPDLNPVEMFWSWLRRQLRAMDLADLTAKRKPVGKTALKERVRRLCRSAKAKQVAKNCIASLRKTCLKVQKNRGGAAGRASE